VRPLVTVEADAAKIHFESDTPDTDLHIRTGDATVTGLGFGVRGGVYTYGAVAHDYQHICAAPCDATLPAGTHRLALSKNGKAPVEPDEAVTIRGPSNVHGTYVDRSGTRIAGWLVLGGSLVASLVMLAASIHSDQDCTSTGSCVPTHSIDMGLAVGSLATMTVGAIVAVILGLQHDGAIIEVTPIDTSLRLPSLERREAAWLAPSSAGSAGLGLQRRF
jgi:hypothetical protein